MSTETYFGLLDLKKYNTWFTLKSCSCAQKAYQEALQAHYSFGKLGGVAAATASPIFFTF